MIATVNGLRTKGKVKGNKIVQNGQLQKTNQILAYAHAPNKNILVLYPILHVELKPFGFQQSFCPSASKICACEAAHIKLAAKLCLPSKSSDRKEF